jgi:hypothetical protein
MYVADKICREVAVGNPGNFPIGKQQQEDCDREAGGTNYMRSVELDKERRDLIRETAVRLWVAKVERRATAPYNMGNNVVNSYDAQDSWAKAKLFADQRPEDC